MYFKLVGVHNCLCNTTFDSKHNPILFVFVFCGLDHVCPATLWLSNASQHEPHQDGSPALSKARLATIGQNFVKAASSAQGSSRLAAAVMLRKTASFGKPSLAKALRRSAGRFHQLRTCKKMVGRIPRHSDSALYEKLAAVAHPTRDFHAKLKKPIIALVNSKSRSARLTGLYSRSQFCKRLANCKVAVRATSSEKGKCDVCVSWQTYAQKQIEHLYKNTELDLEKLLPGYWDAWQVTCETFALDRPDLPRASNFEYAQGLEDFIAKHELGDRSNLSEAAGTQLAAQEDSALGEIRQWLQPIESYDFHLSLINTVNSSWQRAYWRRVAAELGMLWDHMALPYGL